MPPIAALPPIVGPCAHPPRHHCHRRYNAVRWEVLLSIGPMIDDLTLNTSKLHPPAVTTAMIVRPRLVEQLQRGLAGPLTLVCAPAGYGKTTLVAADRSPHLPALTGRRCAAPRRRGARARPGDGAACEHYLLRQSAGSRYRGGAGSLAASPALLVVSARAQSLLAGDERPGERAGHGRGPGAWSASTRWQHSCSHRAGSAAQ
jgi:hypothetical protein